MSHRQKELWLLLFLVVIAGLINSVVASQRMALMFYFLPTLYSAYHFGRRHATLTAFASFCLVGLLFRFNPHIFSHQVDILPDGIESRWFDLGVWGGMLVISAYAMGTLYERRQESMQELRTGYEGMLAILRHFLSNQKYSEAHSYRISMYASRIAESLGLDAEDVEAIRMAALLQNLSQAGIDNDVLLKAANLSKEDLENELHRQCRGGSSQRMGGALGHAIPILMAEQRLIKSGKNGSEAAIEVQVLAVAESFESLMSNTQEGKISPAQAVAKTAAQIGKNYDPKVMNAFVKAFGAETQAASAR